MSGSLPATTSRAVFVSYAREDTPSALRIAEALRSHGVEVWFDQAELRGGDAWDQKIRRQINDCTLFLPIISQHTQERGKGYFRLEWKLAVEQTHLMAEGIAFLAPVVVDDTAESGAVVPPEFLKVQWTRLSGGLPTTQFVDQIKHLLDTSLPAGVTAPPMPMRPAAVAPVLAPAAKSKFPTAFVAGLGVAALALMAYIALRPAEKEKPVPVTAEKSPAEAKPVAPTAPAAPKVDPKSIAVLPFANRSPNKEDEFFTDGIHDDILTNLSNLRELHVVSRTSVEQYRGTNKTLKQVGVELGVAYVLEGGVQRVGNKVHVTGQLIDARTDTHLWAKSFDKDVSDIFAIQAELATAIATELQAVLSPQEKARLARAPTSNGTAYELYLKALTTSKWESARSLLESAVQLDPKFAQAWGALGRVLTQINASNHDPTGALAEKAQQAIDKMAQLAPDEPATLLTLVRYYSKIGDYARADTDLLRAAQALPGSAEIAQLLGDVEKRHYRFPEALAQYRKAYELDRQGPDISSSLSGWLMALRRYDELEQLAREAGSDAGVARAVYLKTGSTREIEAWAAAHPDELLTRANIAWELGAAADYIRLHEELRSRGEADASQNQDTQITVARMASGDTARAKADAAKFVATHKGSIGRIPALNLAVAGETKAAVECMEAYCAGAKKRGVDLDLSTFAFGYASVLAWAGEKDKAVAELARLFKLPAVGMNVHVLRHNPTWKPLQGYPPFEALLADPKNNAPLF